jgi:chemosensory pili system protein ChpA (sensor histidine kinase/response regulator)
MMATELGGLGEMLQLQAFTQLCKSITEELEAAEKVEEIARLALQAWRRSQALILTNQIDSLPTELTHNLHTLYQFTFQQLTSDC